MHTTILAVTARIPLLTPGDIADVATHAFQLYGFTADD
ncbi:hypothetical protein [Escherichia coli Nissle 1917]|nr:hypothetical protein [Escherichia coli Nissle 1917]